MTRCRDIIGNSTDKLDDNTSCRKNHLVSQDCFKDNFDCNDFAFAGPASEFLREIYNEVVEKYDEQ